MRFPQSAFAHRYLDNLQGLEIGGAAHNAFGLNTKNVDYTYDLDSPFKLLEKNMCGEAMPVDMITDGWNLPVEDDSQDFVISSHVLEHAANPVKVLYEWRRVVRANGFILIIVPERDIAGVDTHRPLTNVEDMLQWYYQDVQKEESPCVHWTVWKQSNLIELFNALKSDFEIIDTQNPDDKAANGTTIIVKVLK